MLRITASAGRAAVILCAGLSLARAASAADVPIATIVAVESDNGTDITAKIKVVAGSLYRDQQIDIFTPRVKDRATLVLTPPVEMLMAGDELKVRFRFKSGSFKMSEGFISEAGKIKSYDDGQKLLAAGKGAAKPSAAPTSPSAGGQPASLSCPYKPGDLTRALGLKFGEAERSEAAFPGGKMVTCTYSEASPGFTTLLVGFTVMAAKDFAASMVQLDRNATGKTTPIPGDADGARWKLDQYDENRVALIYDRGGTTRTEISMYGGRFKAKDVQPKLLKLKRVP